MKNNYRYFITHQLLTTPQEFFPFNEFNLSEEFSQYSGFVADYKRTLKGNLVFTGAEFQHFSGLNSSSGRCGDIQITIKKNCDGVFSDWFYGFLRLNKADWDEDHCRVSIPVETDDDYSQFEKIKKDEIDLFSIVADRVVTKLLPPNSVLEFVDYVDTVIRTPFRFWGGVGTPAAGGWVLWKHNYQDNGTSWENHTYWVRVKRTEPCGNPDLLPPWILIQNLCPGIGKVYAQPAALYGKQLLQEYHPTTGALMTYAEVSKIMGDSSAEAIQNIDNGLLWRDVITALLSPIGLVVKSDFFQINPDNASANNYVTGLISKVANLIIYQKSDVKRPRDLNNATICKTTREDLIEGICLFFNLQYKITGSTFRIEHCSYFQKVTGLDLTLFEFQKYVKDKNRYTYESEKLPNTELFKTMEASLVSDFENASIFYSNGCETDGDDGVIKYEVKNITTDLILCLNNPDSAAKLVDDAGIFLMATDEYLGSYYVITEPPVRYYIAPNNPLAWCQLLRDYHKHKRPFISGNMNGADASFISVKPTKKGEAIRVPIRCGDIFSPLDFVKTALGSGTIDRASYALKNCMLELSLLYAMDEDLVVTHAPIANPDGVVTFKNTAVQIDVLANDSDAEGMSTIDLVEITDPPASGTAVVLSDKRIQYTPAAGFTGEISFYYRIKDTSGLFSNVALVTVEVVDPAPLAVNDSYSIVKGTSRGMLSCLTNDQKGETAVSIQVISNISPSTRGVAVTVNPDGTFTYNAPATAGADSFNYTIENNLGFQSTGTININVTEPPTVFTHVLAKSLISAAEACSRFTNPAQRVNYYSDDAVLDVGSVLYSDNGLSVTAYFGYYSDGSSVWRIIATDGVIVSKTSCT